MKLHTVLSSYLILCHVQDEYKDKTSIIKLDLHRTDANE